MATLEIEVLTNDINDVKVRFNEKLNELQTNLTTIDVENNYKFVFEYEYDGKLDNLLPYFQEKMILSELNVLSTEKKIVTYQIISNIR